MTLPEPVMQWTDVVNAAAAVAGVLICWLAYRHGRRKAGKDARKAEASHPATDSPQGAPITITGKSIQTGNIRVQSGANAEDLRQLRAEFAQHRAQTQQQISDLTERLAQGEDHAGLEDDLRLKQAELQALNAKLADLEQAYAEKARLTEALRQEIATLKTHRRHAPADVRETVLEKLAAGDAAGARAAYQRAKADQQPALDGLAHAAFRLGEHAETDVRYADALAHYQDAARFAPRTWRYVTALDGILYTLGRYGDAESWSRQALAVAEQSGTAQERAISLNNLAVLYKAQGRYDEAEPLYRKAIAIGEKTLGAEHPSLAIGYNNLAGLYRAQGRYDEAEPLYRKAIAIGEKTLGAEHPSLAIGYNNLAGLYRAQGRYDEVEPLYQKAIAIGRKTLGADHPNLAIGYNNLAALYRAQGRYDEAEPLYQKAIAIDEKVLGENHPGTATDYNNLAELYRAQGRYNEAEPLYQQAIAIHEKALGENHPGTATDYNNLAELYRAQGRSNKAEPLYQKALRIFESRLGKTHPHTMTVGANLERIRKRKRPDSPAQG